MCQFWIYCKLSSLIMGYTIINMIIFVILLTVFTTSSKYVKF